MSTNTMSKNTNEIITTTRQNWLLTVAAQGESLKAAALTKSGMRSLLLSKKYHAYLNFKAKVF